MPPMVYIIWLLVKYCYSIDSWLIGFMSWYTLLGLLNAKGKIIVKQDYWISSSNKFILLTFDYTLRWRHNDGDSVSNHQPHDCLLKCLFGCTSKKTSKLRVTGLCAGNSPWIGGFPAQMASNAENVSIWWRHHERDLMQDKSSVSGYQWTDSSMWILRIVFSIH